MVSFRTLRMLAILGSPFLIYSGAAGYLENRAFRQHGKVALTNPNPQINMAIHASRKNPDKKYSTYDADLSFTTEDGRTVMVNKPLSPMMLQQLQSGARVEIMYVSTAPEKTRFVREYEEEPTGAIVVIGLLCLSLAFVPGKKDA